MRNAEDLQVFKKSHELTVNLYQLTAKFPSNEKFGLVSQIRRSSVSICSNLMEGSHRNHLTEYKQFAGISRGSVGELKYQLLLSKDLNYISEENYHEYRNKINEISKMLYNLIKSFDQKILH